MCIGRTVPIPGVNVLSAVSQCVIVAPAMPTALSRATYVIPATTVVLLPSSWVPSRAPLTKRLSIVSDTYSGVEIRKINIAYGSQI